MEPIYSPIIPRKKTIIDSPNDRIINSGANPNSKLSQNNNFNIKYIIPEVNERREKMKPNPFLLEHPSFAAASVLH